MCIDTYDSYYCVCRDGYRLAQIEYTCPGKLNRFYFPWAIICTVFFTSRRYASAIYAVMCPSVCPSVRLSQASIVPNG